MWTAYKKSNIQAEILLIYKLNFYPLQLLVTTCIRQIDELGEIGDNIISPVLYILLIRNYGIVFVPACCLC